MMCGFDSPHQAHRVLLVLTRPLGILMWGFDDPHQAERCQNMGFYRFSPGFRHNYEGFDSPHQTDRCQNMGFRL